MVSYREEWRGGVDGGVKKKENRQDNLEMIYVYDVPPPPTHLPQASIADELKLVKITELRPPGLWTYLKRE
jgi:hypothetical protein